MTKLHAVLAQEKHIKSLANSHISDLYKLIQKPALFSGQVRNYLKKSDSGEDLPSEIQEIQLDLADVLSGFRQSLSSLIDVTAQKDYGNQLATASVVVDGQELLADIPATTLLALEKIMTDVRSFVTELPILDPSEAWTMDANSGVSKTKATQTHRTKKIQKPIVLYDATEHHPAQTQMITEDEIVGFWQTQRTSTAISRTEKQMLLGRVNQVLLAVKDARERANDTEVSARPTVAAKIFSYIFEK